ncbi:MAG: LysR family transcriptional regulator [Pseudomonadota bacterium]
MQQFLVIVDNGTVHAAAGEIWITQPALTRSLKILEDSTGEALFEKRGRALKLTPLGKLLAEQARHLLREQQLAEAELLAFRKGESGNLRIGAASVWMTELLPKVIAQVHDE